MGGETKIRPLCNDLYDRHAKDPLTAKWFGAHVDGNRRTADEVKENVFTFFSSGIGGPHAYEGNDMKAAHQHMEIDKHAFHALTNHVFEQMEKHNTGGSAEREEVFDILWSLRPDVMHATESNPSPALSPEQSLWERMGGEAKIRPLCNDLYDMHASDPLTAKWFGAHVDGNCRTANEVKENVFTFFSSGIGGPHEYKGNDMKVAHQHMKIDKHAFHALTNHVLVGMERHQTGGRAEREEVYEILMSLKPDVLHGTNVAAEVSLWDRMGGEAKIRPLCNDLYDMHASDPLTADWFGAHVDGNRRSPDEVKENVFTFFSSGIGGPHEYKGNDMKVAHQHMKIDQHVFHALTNHVLVAMERHKTGGKTEREEVYAILMSLKPDVMHGSGAA